jgi:hypothetical protein
MSNTRNGEFKAQRSPLPACNSDNFICRFYVVSSLKRDISEGLKYFAFTYMRSITKTKGNNRISTRRSQHGTARQNLSIPPRVTNLAPQVLHLDILAEGRPHPRTGNTIPTKPTMTQASSPMQLLQHVCKPKRMSVLAMLRGVGTPCKITRTLHCPLNLQACSKNSLPESKRGVFLAN